MINILIVDDSATEIALLKQIFSRESDFNVVGVAVNGAEALKMIPTLKPDIITMDIQMPIMDGYETTRAIMTQFPTPIVIISSVVNDKAKDVVFRALDAGALSVLEKPKNITSPEFTKLSTRIVDAVRSMSGIRVIKRRFNIKKFEYKPIPTFKKSTTTKTGNFEIVAIGTSVGGPQALKEIFLKLPKDFPVPIVVVQHMTQGYIKGFAEWLNDNTEMTIKVAQNNESLLSKTVYFAPDNHHLQIARVGNKLIAKTLTAPPVSGFCPSATVLLQSVAKVSGKKAVGVLLTGMGNDGAQGMLELKQAEGHTVIQDSESAVVFGMGAVAQSLGAVDQVIPLSEVANYLVKITQDEP